MQVLKNFNYLTKFDKNLQQKNDKVYKIGQNRAKSGEICPNRAKSVQIGQNRAKIVSLYKYVNPYKKK